MAYPDVISIYMTGTSGSYNQPSSKYNRSVVAAANFTATGSNAHCAAFFPSGSAVTVTLFNGGVLSVPATVVEPIEADVASVTSGTAYLLYRN